MQGGVQVYFSITHWLAAVAHSPIPREGQSINSQMLEMLRTACAFMSFPLKARSKGVSAQTALWVLCQPGDGACASSDSAPAVQQFLQPLSWNVPSSCCPLPEPPAIPSSAPGNSWKRCSFPERVETREGDPHLNAAGSPGRLCLWKHPYLGEKRRGSSSIVHTVLTKVET